MLFSFFTVSLTVGAIALAHIEPIAAPIALIIAAGCAVAESVHFAVVMMSSK